MRAMKSVALLACVVLFACGGGGASVAPGLEPEQQQEFSVGLVRGDMTTAITLVVTKPFEEAGTVDLLGTPTGAFEPGPLPMDLPSARKCAFTVAFTPPAAPPDPLQYGTIPLLFRPASGGAAYPVTLRLDAEVETPSVRLLDTDVELGTAAIGEIIPCAVRFENTSVVTPVAVSRVTLSGGDFSLAPDASAMPATVAPGATFVLRLQYAPTDEEADSSVLRVFHSASADPLEATLDGEGMAPRVVFDYGFVALDPISSDSPWLTFDVGPKGTGITIEAWGIPDALLDLVTLEGPMGQVSVDWLRTYPGGSFGCLNLQVPESASGEVLPAEGSYRFRVRDGAETGSDVRVRAIVSQRRDADVGTLDLRVFVAVGLSIPDPATDPKVEAAIGTVDAVLGAKGIRLGKVSFVSLDPRFDVLHDDMERVNMLMVATATLPEGALNLFLVRGIDGGHAVTAPTPGPLWNGTPFSGVILDFDDPSGIAAGAVAAHAIAHYLGDGEGVLGENGTRGALRHPLLRPGLPEEFVSPEGSIDEALIPVLWPGAWCGTCGRDPGR